MRKPISERIENENLEIFIDYRDMEAIPELVSKYETMDEFIDEIQENYQESYDYVIDEFFKTLLKEGYSDEEIEEHRDEIFVNLDLNRFLESEVRVDILLSFYGDDNLDMPSYTHGWLRWLAPAQGYKFSEFKNVLNSGSFSEDFFNNTFKKSVIEEIHNNTHHMTALTVLGKVSVRDYFNLKHKKTIKKIIVPKDAMIGLFNPWIGGGSMMGIELEKDLKIYPKNIFGIGVEDECPYGYSPNQVYGLVNSAWENKIKVENKKRR